MIQPPMIHGGDLGEAMARFGGTRADWLDLSTGINPHAYPLPADLPARFWQGLPGKHDLETLHQAARKAYDVPPETGILAAPGTQALIQWLPRLAAPGQVAILSPTYGEHDAAWREAGFETLASAAQAPLPDAARHLVIVNPNNPDGRLLPLHSLETLAHRVAEREGWLVIDESFIDIAPKGSAAWLCARYPVLILRSFGKFYGLAGIRLGFLIANPALIARFARALGPWSVAGPALAIGTAALNDHAYAAAMRVRLEGEAGALDDVLHHAGLTAMGGTSLYRLVACADARALHTHLAAQRIWVRRFDWNAQLLRFGLPPGAPGLARVRAALHGAPHAALQGMSTLSP